MCSHATWCCNRYPTTPLSLLWLSMLEPTTAHVGPLDVCHLVHKNRLVFIEYSTLLKSFSKRLYLAFELHMQHLLKEISVVFNKSMHALGNSIEV